MDEDENLGDIRISDALICLARKGFRYKDISSILKKSHNVQLSENAIGKRLNRLRFPSRRGPTFHNDNDVTELIKAILQDVPHTVGYRCMTNILHGEGINVRRRKVMEIMRTVDKAGVASRRQRRIKRRVYRSLGPNHTWHMDGYDKLKPYGLAIHGCIDGFSRKIMWLSAGPSNKDPAIIAGQYIGCVRKLKGCPLVLQADPGTENGIIGALQCVFRHEANDSFSGIHSYHVARSVFNQRIEAWWSMLRRRTTEWWIQFLRDVESNELFHQGNEIEMFCLRFCFMPLLQSELDTVVTEWNSHHVTRSRDAICPNGRPDLLYYLPENSGCENCLHPVSEEDIEWGSSLCKSSSRSGSPEFDAFGSTWCERNGREDALTWQKALENYIELLCTLQ